MNKITVTVLAGVLFMGSGATAFAAGNINCAHPAQSPQKECIETAITAEGVVRAPIGYVAYSAKSCDYVILREYATDAFILADVFRGDQPHRGMEVGRAAVGFDGPFRLGKASYRIGYDFVKLNVEQTKLAAVDAVDAYMKVCAE